MLSIVFTVLLASNPALAKGKGKGEDPGYAPIREQLAAAPAAPHQVAAPDSPEPTPWAVGQWTAVKVTDPQGSVSWRRTAIVAHDDCGWWAEAVTLADGGDEILKVCYSSPPWPRTEDDLYTIVKVIIVQEGTKKPQVVDLTTRKGTEGAAWHLHHAFQPLSYDASNETASVEGPAGAFDGCLKAKVEGPDGDPESAGTAWVHSSVPVFGIVKAEYGGRVTELVDFGLTGAATLLPDVGGH